MNNIIQLSKHIFGDLDIPTKNLIGIYGPRKFNNRGLSDDEIRQKIRSPIGTRPLAELVKNRSSILIVTDDNTRNTPLSRILPIVLSELEDASIHPENIQILIGLGTHRPMTESEINHKFGKELSRRYMIVNHAWEDPSQLTSLGYTELGFEVIINRMISDADFIISIGSIVPHATAGFSGGGKTIMPGICGEKTIEDTHWAALDYPMEEIIGIYDNQVRRSIVNVCRKVGLGFIVNTILINNDEVFDIVSGDVEEAHYQGTEICRSVYGVSIPQKADIVIAEAFPTDIDLRQSIKGICTADIACKDQGTIILLADCPEGIAPQFPNFVRHGFRNPDRLFKEVEEGIFPEKLLAYTLVAIGRIISKTKKAILVTDNIPTEDIQELGFLPAPNLQTAWEKARAISNGADTIILKEAGELLPILDTV